MKNLDDELVVNSIMKAIATMIEAKKNEEDTSFELFMNEQDLKSSFGRESLYKSIVRDIADTIQKGSPSFKVTYGAKWVRVKVPNANITLPNKFTISSLIMHNNRVKRKAKNSAVKLTVVS